MNAPNSFYFHHYIAPLRWMRIFAERSPVSKRSDSNPSDYRAELYALPITNARFFFNADLLCKRKHRTGKRGNH